MTGLGMKRNERNGVVYYTIPLFEKTGLVRHGFSTRVGGVSTGECATMNFSFSRADEPANVVENFICLSGALDIDPGNLVITRQVHGTHCHIASREDAGRLISSDGPVIAADSLIANQPDLALVKHFADCVPVFLLDPIHRAIGLVHAGWRGTAAGIAGLTVRAMMREYQTKPKDLLAAVGPSIGPCCFEVGEDVAQALAQRYPSAVVRIPGRKPHVDLWRCNELDLIQSGIANEGITTARLCTACLGDTFYSHRRDRGKTGSMVAVMALNFNN